MATEIKVPTLGESVTEATVSKWLKAVGDHVAADEAVVELETDKVTLEVNAPAAGTLAAIAAPEGATVAIGALLGTLGEGAASAARPAEKPVAQPVAEPARVAAPVAAMAAGNGSGAAQMGPAARKTAADLGVDPATVSGSGKDGRVTKGDVIQFAEARAPQAPSVPAPHIEPAMPVQPGAREERVRMTRLRKRIAERLKQAQNSAAMLTTFNEVDMSRLMTLRTSFNETFEQKHGVKLGFMSIFVKATIAALKEIPAVNSEIDGDDIVYKNHYDIGVAVGTEQGLVVPVLRDADQLGFAEIEKRIADLAKRARAGKLQLDELQGGTFSITNGGIYGSLMSTPILNPPQSGILGMHKIEKRPVVVSDKAGDRIEIRPMMYVALSYDHRIVDGREAVTFLVRIKEAVEDPQRLLFEI